MIENVVFDIGQVLLVWDPDLLYQELIPDHEERKDFFNNIVTWEWRDRSDFLVTVRENVVELASRHPDKSALIMAWDAQFEVMMPGEVPGAFDVVRQLKARDRGVYAIANFAADKYRSSLQRFPVLQELDGMLVSSEVGSKKPDSLIYQAFLDQFDLTADSCLFIDDDQYNVDGARSVGMHAMVFTTVASLRAQLLELGLVGHDGPYG